MNNYLKTFQENKKKFATMYFIIFFLTLGLSVTIYKASLDKIARIIVSEITNSVLNENFNSIRNTCIKIVPEIFEEVQIFKKNKKVFDYKIIEPKFYFTISEIIFSGKESDINSDIKIAFKADFIPLVFISTLMSFVSVLITVPFLIFEYNKNELNKNNYFISLSRKLAHDIRSPLSTLNLISGGIERQEIKELQLAVISQINQLAEGLLQDTKQNILLGYSDLLTQIENEFKFKANRHNLIFDNTSFSEGNLYFAPSFLYSVMNNLIQNAIDATPCEESKIVITLKLLEDVVIILIQDNGVGIPAEVLKKLGSMEVSYGKGSKGNGVGFFTANKNISLFGGKLKISSEINFGTLIEIILPK